MKNKKTIKQILIALGVAVAILLLYAAFSGGFSQNQAQGGLVSKNGKSVSGGVVREGDVTVANQKILKILGSVNNIQLNDDIFSNPLFRQLRDSRFTIPRPIRIGRPNPFASIGAEMILSQQQEVEEGQRGQQEGATTFFEDTNTQQ